MQILLPLWQYHDKTLGGLCPTLSNVFCIVHRKYPKLCTFEQFGALWMSMHAYTHVTSCDTSNEKSALDAALTSGKWNESGFRPPLCTYRLNWARRTSWGWWDDWDDTVLQTQDSKFEPWRSEAEHATSRSRRLPTILTFTRGWGRNNFVSFKPPRPGTEPRTLAWKAAVLTTTLGPPPLTSGTLEYY